MEIEDIISSGILELYAAGLTSIQETEEVTRWLHQYPELTNELAAITASLEAYAQSLAIAPSPLVKEKLLAQINEGQNKTGPGVLEKNDGAKIIQAPFWKIAVAASIALLIGSTILNLSLYNKYARVVKGLEASQQTVAALQEQNREMADGLSVVQSKFSVPVALNGLEAAPDAAAKIFWMKNTGEVFIDASNLPDAPAGKQYQLWGIVDGKPVDGGMLVRTSKGVAYRMQKMKTFGKAEAFAITLETENGNPSPQGPMFVMGKM